VLVTQITLHSRYVLNACFLKRTFLYYLPMCKKKESGDVQSIKFVFARSPSRHRDAYVHLKRGDSVSWLERGEVDGEEGRGGEEGEEGEEEGEIGTEITKLVESKRSLSSRSFVPSQSSRMESKKVKRSSKQNIPPCPSKRDSSTSAKSFPITKNSSFFESSPPSQSSPPSRRPSPFPTPLCAGGTRIDVAQSLVRLGLMRPPLPPLPPIFSSSSSFASPSFSSSSFSSSSSFPSSSVPSFSPSFCPSSPSSFSSSSWDDEVLPALSVSTSLLSSSERRERVLARVRAAEYAAMSDDNRRSACPLTFGCSRRFVDDVAFWFRHLAHAGDAEACARFASTYHLVLLEHHLKREEEGDDSSHHKRESRAKEASGREEGGSKERSSKERSSKERSSKEKSSEKRSKGKGSKKRSSKEKGSKDNSNKEKSNKDDGTSGRSSFYSGRSSFYSGRSSFYSGRSSLYILPPPRPNLRELPTVVVRSSDADEVAACVLMDALCRAARGQRGPAVVVEAQPVDRTSRIAKLAVEVAVQLLCDGGVLTLRVPKRGGRVREKGRGGGKEGEGEEEGGEEGGGEKEGRGREEEGKEKRERMEFNFEACTPFYEALIDAARGVARDNVVAFHIVVIVWTSGEVPRCDAWTRRAGEERFVRLIREEEEERAREEREGREGM